MVVTLVLSVLTGLFGAAVFSYGVSRAGTDSAFLPTFAGIISLILAGVALIVNHEYRVGRWQ